MLPAQLANVAAAALPKAPPVDAFLARLKDSVAPKTPIGSPSNLLFGDTFADHEGKPKQTEKNQKMAFAAALDFAHVLETEHVVIDDLDEWMAAFAKWTLSLDSLFDEGSSKEAAVAQRAAMCHRAGVVMRSWAPQTLKTVVNALALMYKQTGPESGIVPSVESQFPKYCRIFNAACTRHRNASARQEPTAVLKDTEVQTLYDKTNWLSWYEAQRMNFLLLAYQLGQRPESLVRLCVGNSTERTLPDGTKAIEVRFGTMKNLQGNQANAGKPAHQQLIMAHDNPKLCAVAAYQRHVGLLGSNPRSEDPLFRSARLMTKTAPPQALSTASIRGLTQWVREEVGGPVTFKDCARRAWAYRRCNGE